LLKGSAEKYEDVLSHALVQAFIYLKYNKAYPFILFSIVMHVSSTAKTKILSSMKEYIRISIAHVIPYDRPRSGVKMLRMTS
jgi:hypothetical protein